MRWERSGGGPGRVRITPQLIRVADDTHLWSERYDRALSDVFAIQGDVADKVAKALDLTLGSAESNALRVVPTRDLEAYDLYLRALELERRYSDSSAIAAQIQVTSAALEHDPDFAEALALLSKARVLGYWLYCDRRGSELERARAEAERAVALRPDSAEAHRALGYYHYQGRLDYETALVELRKALDSDPLNSADWGNQAETPVYRRKYAEAVKSYGRSASLNPTSFSARAYLAWVHVLWRGDTATAGRLLQQAAEVPGLEDP